MPKDKADKTTEKNLEYNSARAEKTKRDNSTSNTKDDLLKNLKDKKR